MKIVVKQANPDPPYSLHDAYISSVQVEEDTLRLTIPCGYVCTTPPYGQVDGDVEITGVDWDFSCVYVMAYQDVLCGNYGAFTGRKMTVETFLAEFSEASLDVMDETYGYNQVKLDGFLHLGERCLEFCLDLCYTGEFRYLLKE